MKKYFIGLKEKYFTATSCRMIPIAVSSNEAKYIRKLLQIQHKGSRIKQNPDNDHLRHPRKINKSDTKVISPSINGIDITKEYQIVYKEATTTTTVRPEVTTSRTKNEIEANAHALIRPRGPPRGFFNREKFQQILTSNLRSDKDQNQGENWGLKNHNFVYRMFRKSSTIYQ